MPQDNPNPGQPGNPDPGTPGTDDEAAETAAAAAGAPSWKDSLDPDIKAHPSLAAFKEPKDLAKSWVNAQKLIGKDKLPLPGKNAKPEDWDLVFDRLGRPKTPAEYAIPTDYAPPELTSEEGVKEFQTIAHKLRLLPDQAVGLYKWWADQQIGAMNVSQEKQAILQKETETALRKEFGYAYGQKIEEANRVLLQFNSKEDAEYIKKQYGNDPILIKFLSRLGGKISEDGIIGKGEGAFLSPEEALAEIQRIKANPAFITPGHPEQKLLVARMAQLHKMAYPAS